MFWRMGGSGNCWGGSGESGFGLGDVRVCGGRGSGLPDLCLGGGGSPRCKSINFAKLVGLKFGTGGRSIFELQINIIFPTFSH